MIQDIAVSIVTVGVASLVRGAIVKIAADTAADTAANDIGDTVVNLATSCANSFTADTPVTMADGTKRLIKDVKVGDEVLATDPQTGVTKGEAVQALIRHSGQHSMALVTLADGSMLDATSGHPIWDATQRMFRDAGELRAGDRIETSNGGQITIRRVVEYSANLTAYNLQIAQIHTYYAGITPVLVHNSCGLLTNAQASQMAQRVGYRATNQFVRGQRVFTNGKSFIVQDIDSHSGGLWKMANSVRDLGSKTTRTGTYNYNLDYVGP